jgi:hypothetical protein
MKPISKALLKHQAVQLSLSEYFTESEFGQENLGRPICLFLHLELRKRSQCHRGPKTHLERHMLRHSLLYIHRLDILLYRPNREDIVSFRRRPLHPIS